MKYWPEILILTLIAVVFYCANVKAQTIDIANGELVVTDVKKITVNDILAKCSAGDDKVKFYQDEVNRLTQEKSDCIDARIPAKEMLEGKRAVNWEEFEMYK